MKKSREKKNTNNTNGINCCTPILNTPPNIKIYSQNYGY